MEESKHHSQSDKLWFQKSNYMAQFLSEESKDIVKMLIEKNKQK